MLACLVDEGLLAHQALLSVADVGVRGNGGEVLCLPAATLLVLHAARRSSAFGLGLLDARQKFLKHLEVKLRLEGKAGIVVEALAAERAARQRPADARRAKYGNAPLSGKSLCSGEEPSVRRVCQAPQRVFTHGRRQT